MQQITPCLWFDGQAEDAATFWTSIFSDSRVDRVNRAASDTPSGPKGSVITVEFTLRGQPFVGLNGGPDFQFTEAISFMIDCADQEEVDRYWEALTAGGGEPGPCGWLKDKFGVHWQVIPTALPRYLKDKDKTKSQRVMEAMMQMVKIDIAQIEAARRGT